VRCLVAKTKYLETRVPRGLLPENERKALLALNKAGKTDYSFVDSGDDLVLKFSTVDVAALRERATKSGASKSGPILKLINQLDAVKGYGVKGKKRVYVDYDAERKVQGRKKKAENRGIYYYAQDNAFSKQNNELPPQYTNKIVCADSEEMLKKLPDNCVDLIFTSPPYNFGLDYEGQTDAVHWEKYLEKLFAIFRECIRVTKHGGRIIVNVQPLFSDYIPIHHIISDFFMKNKMIWKGEILWEKNNYNCKYTAWGSWKSPGHPYLKYTWEFLEIFCKGDLRHGGESSRADITGDEFKKWVYAKWSIAPERGMKEWGHPAMFPEKLAEQALKLFSFEGDVILDPFNGVGTTTKVAAQTGRRYIGIDVSPQYCKKAQQRISSISLQKKLK
jgi:DNA modification methylase